MKTFKQHYTYTQFNSVINEQLTSTSSEDVIVENIYQRNDGYSNPTTR